MLTLTEIKIPKVIQRIFDGTPAINVTIHKSLLKTSEKGEPDFLKKKKLAKPEKIERNHPKKEINSLKTMIKSIKPVIPQSKPETKPLNQPNPVSDFSVTNLLNEVQAFQKKAEESKKMIKKEEPINLSEKYKAQAEANSAKANPEEE